MVHDKEDAFRQRRRLSSRLSRWSGLIGSGRSSSPTRRFRPALVLPANAALPALAYRSPLPSHYVFPSPEGLFSSTFFQARLVVSNNVFNGAVTMNFGGGWGDSGGGGIRRKKKKKSNSWKEEKRARLEVSTFIFSCQVLSLTSSSGVLDLEEKIEAIHRSCWLVRSRFQRNPRRLRSRLILSLTLRPMVTETLTKPSRTARRSLAMRRLMLTSRSPRREVILLRGRDTRPVGNPLPSLKVTQPPGSGSCLASSLRGLVFFCDLHPEEAME
jgi:hypothetical protein